MLHTKSQGHRPSDPGEYFKRFLPHTHVGHLGHLTSTIRINYA